MSESEVCSECKKSPSGRGYPGELRDIFDDSRKVRRIMCNDCYKNLQREQGKKAKRIKFLKSNWFRWITIGLAIIGLIITSQFM